MKAESCRSIDAGKNRCLARGALRPACDAQARISGNHDAVKRNLIGFILKDSQRFGVRETIERIMWPARADAETVNEEKKHGHCVMSSRGGQRSAKGEGKDKGEWGAAVTGRKTI